MSSEIHDPGMPHGAARPAAAEIFALRLEIHGRVQGVGYRDWLVDAAQALDLAGWVRNRRDGSVEAHAQGETGRLDRLIEQCRAGPRAARVDQVVVIPVPRQDLTGFHRRSTA